MVIRQSLLPQALPTASYSSNGSSSSEQCGFFKAPHKTRVNLSQHKTAHWDRSSTTSNRCDYTAAAAQHRCHNADPRFVPIASDRCVNSVVQTSLLRVGGCRRWGSLFHRRCLENRSSCPLPLPATRDLPGTRQPFSCPGRRAAALPSPAQLFSQRQAAFR